MNNLNGNTKQRILYCAANLFAEKGFTETTTRELAEAAGLNPATMYYYFPSKTAILEHMMEDYSAYNTDVFKSRDITGILRRDPSTNGILSCLQLAFPPEQREYYIKVLCVLLQEQLRNPVVGAYIAEKIILNAEKNVRTIINLLIELGALSQDTDPDYWMKIHSSLMYSFAIRMMLGIGDTSQGFDGMNMAEMLRHNYDIMFEKCGTAKAGRASGSRPQG